MLATVFGVLAPRTASAAQTIPYKVNFQGRLTDNSGNVLSDGSYNIKFRLFDASTSGTNLWEEDRVYGGSDQRIQVQNGLFNIQFGDVTSLSPSLFNAALHPNLYLEVELPTPATATCATNGCASFTEGAMTPRQTLASSPYAFNADNLDGLDATAFAQLTATNTFTAANLFAPTAASTVALTVKATTAGSTNSLEVFDSGGTRQAFFDATGALTVAQAISAPTSTNTINNLVINNGALSAVTGYAQASGNFLQSGSGTFGTGTGGVALNGDTTIAAGKSLILPSGSGTIQQTYTTSTATNGQTLAFANTNAGAGVTMQGINITPTNTTTTSSGTNVMNIINFAAGGALAASDNTNGLNFASATGYTNFIKTPTFVLSSAGALTGVASLAVTATTATAITASTTSSNALSATALTTGAAVNATASSTGRGLLFNTTNVGLTTGSAVAATGLASGTLVGYTGALININPTRTHTAATAITDSGQFLNLTRSNTINNASGTFNVTGALANLQSTCTVTAGTCADSANILNLNQQYASATGTVLNVQGAGTGQLANLDATNASANGVAIDIQSSATGQYALKLTSNNAATNILYARGDGRVGIGTITPGSLLDVAGTANATAFSVGGTLGSSATCSGGQMLQNPTLTNGIITAGTCATPSGTGANTALSNLTTTSINQSLLSSADNTLNLGSAADVWANVFTANIDAGTTTTALTIGGTNATALTIGRSGVVTGLPGGLTTSGGNIATANGTLNTGSGTITSTGAITGGSFKIGASDINTGGTLSNVDYLDTAQAITATKTFSKSGGAAIVLSGTPAASGSILQVGSALSSGLAAGTLISANGAFSGDLLNLQVSNATKLKVDNTGAITLAGAISAPTATNTINGLIINGGALSGATGVTLTSGNITTPGNITTSGTGAISSASTITVGSFASATTTPVCSNAGVLATCNALPSSTSLQQAYGNGNTISTSGADIGFTLNSSQNFTVATAAGATGSTTFSLADGANPTPPAQLVLIKNNDVNQILAAGISVQSAAGGITSAFTASGSGIATAFDASAAGITTALAIGAHAITGTNFSVTGSGAVTAASLSTGSGAISGGALTGTSLGLGSGNITTSGTIGGGAITGTSLSSSGGNITAGAGTISGATINATTAYQANGALGTTSSCGAGAALTGASFTQGIQTAAGSCTTFQAAGAYLVQAPAGTTNTITAASGAQALIIKGTNGTSTNLIDIYNTAASPTLQSSFNQNGAFTTLQPITAPTASNTINGLIINSGALSGVTGFTQTSGTASIASAATSGSVLSAADASFSATGATLANFTFTNTNASATSTTVSGLTITPTGTANSNTNATFLNSLNFPSLAAATNNTFVGLNFGTGYTDLLRYNGTSVINGTGQVNGAQLQSSSVANAALANSSITINGTGISGGGAVSLGGTLSLAVVYGSTTNTAVQGSNTLVCPSASGTNITGTGNTLTLGTSGGTCNAIGIVSNPTFTTSVTSPSFTGTGAVALTSGTGTALTLDAANGTILLGTNTTTVQKAATALSIDLATAATSTLTVTNSNASNVANLSVEGGVTIGSGQVFSIGATGGATIAACTSGQYLASAAATGGLTTAGTCTTADFQNAYTNSTSPATLSLNTSAKDFVINATDQTTDPNILMNLQCATCSAGAGRFAVQDNGTDLFTVNPVGSIAINPATGQNLAITQAGSSGTRITASSVPTVDQFNIDNTTTTGVATAGVNGASINYKGGAAAVEAAGMRIDFTPGTTSGGTWSGLRIVAGATGPVSGVNEYGLKLEGPTTPGTGQENALEVGTGWDIGLDIQSGGLQLADMSSDPATPASGQLRVYSRLVSGRSMLSAKGSSGISYALQPSLAQQNVFIATPGSGTAATTLSTTGGYYALAGTAPGTPSATEANGYLASFATTTTAGTVAGFNGATNAYYRGSVANGADGFFFVTRITLNDATLANYTSTTTGVRMFYGLSDQTAAVMAASASPAGNYAGFSFVANRSGEGGIMQFMTRDGTTETHSATAVTLAASKTYDLYMYMKPRDSTVYWRIDNLTDGATPVEGNKTTNLPTTSVAMKPMDILTNLSAATRTFGFQRMYVETDR